jgi:CRISPR-associated protein Cst2
MENSITITMIFEGSALNRNEKIGGNILSIKKLNVNGIEKSYISKVAIRHYLFTTLINAYGWKEAQISNDRNVLQFDISKDDIISCEELDAFGYMNTNLGQTRKSPLHITKAISISPYEQDIAMYANHDLTRRAKEQGTLDIEANPDPYNKEEHTSLYKISFTVDGKKFGTDRWIVNGNVEFDKNKGELNLGQIRTINNAIKKDNKYLIKDNNNNEQGEILVKKLENETYIVDFISNKRGERIRQILNAIHNGLIAHSSGESNTIVPLFLIAGEVKVPSPVFHSYIDVKRKEDGTFEVIGVNDALKNNWLEENVYIFDTEKVHSQTIQSSKIIVTERNKFLETINLNEDENNNSNSGK